MSGQSPQVREGLRRALVEHEAVQLLGLTREQAAYLVAQWFPVATAGGRDT